MLPVGKVLPEQRISRVQPHPLVVGEDHQRRQSAAAALAHRHHGSRIQHPAHRRIDLTLVKPRRIFRQPEGIAHSMEADAAAAAEFAVGVVIKRTPEHRAAHGIVAAHRILHTGMAQRVLHQPLLRVKPLGGIHMPRKLGNQIGHLTVKPRDLLLRPDRTARAVVNKLVEGKNILQKLA